MTNRIASPFNTDSKPLQLTDLVLRDAHQSLFATRLRLDDMLPIAAALDEIGYWSLESWGGATFDACIRYLGEDPWQRLRELKKVMPKTKQQMLLRGQNLLGYRHYADDVVDKFVERAVANGMDVFRIFDAMNDPRNFMQAVKAVKKQGGHAQGALSYTVSPVHTMQTWIDLAQQLADIGVDSICIKDMSGILEPYVAYELIHTLKQQVGVELQLHCHATAGLSEMTLLKAVEAGIDRVDTAISSMSGTYGHPATESLIATLKGTPRDTGIDLLKIEPIADYFRAIRKKYHGFEGQLRGTDARILVAQVPGGMLTNLESQLKSQNALDRFDEVLQEIPKVRQDLGYIALVTPTSQIVGSQAVINVMTGERYSVITKETAGVLKGEYGQTPASVDTQLQQRVLKGAAPITCRPADNLAPELAQLEENFLNEAKAKGVQLADHFIDDLLTIALFPQVGWTFLENRDNPAAFEPKPALAESAVTTVERTTPTSPSRTDNSSSRHGRYTVTVNNQSYLVEVNENDTITALSKTEASPISSTPAASGLLQPIEAPLSGVVIKVLVKPQQAIKVGDTLMILEAMKMETEIKSAYSGTVQRVMVKEGETVKVADQLLAILL